MKNRTSKQLAEIDAALCDQIMDKWEYRAWIRQELAEIKARLDKLEKPEASPEES